MGYQQWNSTRLQVDDQRVRGLLTEVQSIELHYAKRTYLESNLPCACLFLTFLARAENLEGKVRYYGRLPSILGVDGLLQ